MNELIELEKRIDNLLIKFVITKEDQDYNEVLYRVKKEIDNIKKQKEAGIDSNHLKQELL